MFSSYLPSAGLFPLLPVADAGGWGRVERPGHLTAAVESLEGAPTEGGPGKSQLSVSEVLASNLPFSPLLQRGGRTMTLKGKVLGCLGGLL